VTQNCPIEIARKIELSWERRFHAAALRAFQNDGRLCPVCKEYSSIGPVAAEYRSDGFVRRHWLCRSCNNTFSRRSVS
jgi:transposase-like protein